MGRTVITRAGWNATPPSRPFSRRWRKTVGIVLHHGGVRGTKPGPATVKTFERHHLSRGWKGIAYNWLVDDGGVIYEGRGNGMVGGATKGWNSRTESICYTGWGDGPMSNAAREAIAELVGDIQSRYGNKLWVKGHRDFASTACPGGMAYGWMKDGMQLPVDSDPEPQIDWAAVRAYVDALGVEVAKKPLSKWRRSRGQAVRLVQRHMKVKGIDPGPVDGIYGSKTASAVKQFQWGTGLPANGAVNGVTWRALFG